MPLFKSDLSPAHAALAAMAYLLIKHAAADFLLQTKRQMEEKGVYGARGGLLHSLIHIVLTAPVFLIAPPINAGLIATLLAAEFMLHYHIDWTKEQVVRANGWTLQETYFWWAIGVDQMLHGLTYVALLWVAFAL